MEVMTRSVLATALAIAMVTSSLALDRPAVWRDPDTSCAYLSTPQGGISVRYRADGTIDCPNATQDGGSARGTLDDLARELGRASTRSDASRTVCGGDQKSAYKAQSHQHTAGKRCFQ